VVFLFLGLRVGGLKNSKVCTTSKLGRIAGIYMQIYASNSRLLLISLISISLRIWKAFPKDIKAKSTWPPLVSSMADAISL